jgi:CRISPR-associated protein Cas2
MLEPHAGVFVGTMSATVREKLWDRITRGLREGGAVAICSSDNEQGFVLRTWGKTSKQLEDFEGLLLVKRVINAQ